MTLDLTTPALLFPTVSLLLLAYTNRFLTIANIVRGLHGRYQERKESVVLGQIKNLRVRLRLIRNMQLTGVLSLLGAVATMFLLFAEQQPAGQVVFAISLLLLIVSIVYSAVEITISTKALNIELGDLEGLGTESPKFLGLFGKPKHEEDRPEG